MELRVAVVGLRVAIVGACALRRLCIGVVASVRDVGAYVLCISVALVSAVGRRIGLVVGARVGSALGVHVGIAVRIVGVCVAGVGVVVLCVGNVVGSALGDALGDDVGGAVGGVVGEHKGANPIKCTAYSEPCCRWIRRFMSLECVERL